MPVPGRPIEAAYRVDVTRSWRNRPAWCASARRLGEGPTGSRVWSRAEPSQQAALADLLRNIADRLERCSLPKGNWCIVALTSSTADRIEKLAFWESFVLALLLVAPWGFYALLQLDKRGFFDVQLERRIGTHYFPALTGPVPYTAEGITGESIFRVLDAFLTGLMVSGAAIIAMLLVAFALNKWWVARHVSRLHPISYEVIVQRNASGRWGAQARGLSASVQRATTRRAALATLLRRTTKLVDYGEVSLTDTRIQVAIEHLGGAGRSTQSFYGRTGAVAGRGTGEPLGEE